MQNDSSLVIPLRISIISLLVSLCLMTVKTNFIQIDKDCKESKYQFKIGKFINKTKRYFLVCLSRIREIQNAVAVPLVRKYALNSASV